MKNDTSNFFRAAIDGTRFGLLMGSGAALLSVFLPGFHPEQLATTFLCPTLGGLLGAVLLHGAKALKALYQNRQPPPDFYGKDI